MPLYDDFTPPLECHKFVELCSNAYLTFVDNSDHFFHVEQFKVDLVTAFLVGQPLDLIPGHSPQ